MPLLLLEVRPLMLDAARITFADHRAYNLSGFYMVCTSNIGYQQLLRPTRLPFTALERAVIAELHRLFRQELIGRFHEKIVFKHFLRKRSVRLGAFAISEELDRFNGFDLTISEEAFEFQFRRGIQKTLGARPMRRTVDKFIGDAARDALKSRARSSGVLTVSTLNDRLIIQ